MICLRQPIASASSISHAPQFGPVDILVNNAAVTFLAPVEEFSEKRFRLMVELQMWAPYHLTQLVLPDHVRARRRLDF